VPIIGAKYGRRPSGAFYRVSSQHTKGSEQSKDKMKFTGANKNDIFTMKIKWHWSEIILDLPKKNIYTMLYFLIFFKNVGERKE